MKIGVVSDTHGSLRWLKPALATLEAHGVEVVLHCGDVGGVEVIEALVGWPSHFVRGNCDAGMESELAAACTGQATWHGEFASLTLGEVRVALLHGDDERRKRDALASSDYDVVCVGHTHVAERREVGRTLLFNPGALFRTSSPSIGLIDGETGDARIVPIERIA